MISRFLRIHLVVIATIAGVASAAPSDSHRPHAGMLRFPDVSATHIVFAYGNDLWIVPRNGGMASPLAGPPGQELMPKFSADGRTIAFVGNYEGNRDLYTIPVDGGVSQRVTYHPATEQLCDWTPDGGLLFMTNGFAGLPRQQQLYTVPVTGGLPTQIPVPYGANGAISDDGTWLAYTPHSRDFRTWKRYRGGMATDVWLFNLKTSESKKITNWEGTDTLPMWHGKTVYYLSDAGSEHRLNIWSYDTTSGKTEQITKIADYDVKWPSMGPGANGQGEIVYQKGPELFLLDLGTKQSTAVTVDIPGDRPKLRPKQVDAADFVAAWNISSTGKRALFEARGDIWTVPAKEGAPRRLTRTSGTAERDAIWSPDGKQVAYLSDATGEYEIYVVAPDGKSEARQVTKGGDCYRYLSDWSPDSKHIIFTDKTGALYLCTVESGEVKLIDKDPWTNRMRSSWSHDSRWVAYARSCDNQQGAIWIYNVETGEKNQVTSGMFNDASPTFDRKGDFLYFASNREFSAPIYEDLGNSWVYSDLQLLHAVPLRKDVKSPLAPKSDEEKPEDKADADKKDEDKKDDEKKGDDESAEKKDDSEGKDQDKSKEKGKDKDKKEDKPVVIDFDGFEARAFQLPVDRGGFGGLSVNDKGQLIYVRLPARSQRRAKAAVKLFDMNDEKADKKEEKTVASDTGGFAMTADGKKLLVRKEGKSFYVVDAAADQKLDKAVPMAGMGIDVDPREEWRQIFTEAWRLFRDFFYVPTMHGVDWPAIRKQYEVMLADCSSREDLTYIIGEMISELNVGHAYVRGFGDGEKEPNVSVGMLGCDFAMENGAYRITKIYEGAPWDSDARSPLKQPGSVVNEGEYLLAINSIPLDTSRDPWASLEGMAGINVTLTVSENPTVDDKARDVVVKPEGSEAGLRYRAWIEKNRAYVAEKTGGKSGYIYVPDTGVNGQNDLVRQFYGQVDRGALIIDERWNGGGQIPTRFIELLNRPNTNYFARRDGRDWPWPPDAQQGPKCMLINGLAGSGGDMFPWLFRFNKMGKLIGMRTWGGLVGISGNPSFIDSGDCNVPTFGFYENDGTWGVEGHGVDPDIEVIDDPGKMAGGKDVQLDAAIGHILEELERNPHTPPKRPEPPNRSGMGLKPDDR